MDRRRRQLRSQQLRQLCVVRDPGAGRRACGRRNPRTSSWTIAELVPTTPMPLTNHSGVEGHRQPQRGGSRQRHQRRRARPAGRAPRRSSQACGSRSSCRSAVNVAELIVETLRPAAVVIGFVRARARTRQRPGRPGLGLSRAGLDGRGDVERTGSGRQGQNPTTTIAFHAGAGPLHPDHADRDAADRRRLGNPARPYLHRRRQAVEAQKVSPA